MKIWKIYDLVSGSECCEVEAGTQKSALKKFQKGLLSSGFYWIEKVGHWYVLRSSFGSEFTAYSPITYK